MPNIPNTTSVGHFITVRGRVGVGADRARPGHPFDINVDAIEAIIPEPKMWQDVAGTSAPCCVVYMRGGNSAHACYESREQVRNLISGAM